MKLTHYVKTQLSINRIELYFFTKGIYNLYFGIGYSFNFFR